MLNSKHGISDMLVFNKLLWLSGLQERTFWEPVIILFIHYFHIMVTIVFHFLSGVCVFL